VGLIAEAAVEGDVRERPARRRDALRRGADADALQVFARRTAPARAERAREPDRMHAQVRREVTQAHRLGE
jgi:hypothetical protein